MNNVELYINNNKPKALKIKDEIERFVQWLYYQYGIEYYISSDLKNKNTECEKTRLIRK